MLAPADQTSAPPVRIDWRLAVLTLLVAILVFSALALPVSGPGPLAAALGLRPSMLERYRTQVQNHTFMWGLWMPLLPLVFAVARRAQHYGLASPRAVLLHLAACFALSMVHSVLWGVLNWLVVTSPNRSFAVAVRAIVSYVFASDFLRYVVIAALYHMLLFQAETRERIRNEARLRIRLAEARLEALEARLHPHFLFNTLNTISSLIRSSPQAAIRVVDDLGDLLRAALHAEPGKEVTLATELALLDRYVAIQQARFSDRLRVSIETADDTTAASVPQLILQPIVENAVQHGIAPREASGTVNVSSSRHGDMLRLTVRDDGVGFGQAPPRPHTNGGNGRGIGLANTRARLEELYGSRFTLDIAAAEPTGTIVTIELPFHTATARPERVTGAVS